MSANETIADIVAAKRREAQRLIESAEASAMCGETMAGTPYTEEDLEFARQDAKEMLAEADRLEAAMKREAEKLNLVIQAQRIEIDAEQDRQRRERGDAAALRDALEALNRIDTRGLKRLLYELVEADIFDGGLINKIIAAVDKAKAALAAPPRNCDVGTAAEEQTTRYRTFCSAHKYLGSDLSYMCKGFGKGRCPFFNSNTKSKCELAWAQMPYKEGDCDAD